MDLRQEINNCINKGFRINRGIAQRTLSRNDLLDLIMAKIKERQAKEKEEAQKEAPKEVKPIKKRGRPKIIK